MKRLVALFLVLLLSIESFGAVVSDNDGSAFITKAEFDSLKNNFQSQIDQYNTSIDSKIDGAIASYLAGINVQKESELSILYDKYGINGVSDLKLKWVSKDNTDSVCDKANQDIHMIETFFTISAQVHDNPTYSWEATTIYPYDGSGSTAAQNQRYSGRWGITAGTWDNNNKTVKSRDVQSQRSVEFSSASATNVETTHTNYNRLVVDKNGNVMGLYKYEYLANVTMFRQDPRLGTQDYVKNDYNSWAGGDKWTYYNSDIGITGLRREKNASIATGTAPGGSTNYGTTCLHNDSLTSLKDAVFYLDPTGSSKEYTLTNWDDLTTYPQFGFNETTWEDGYSNIDPVYFKISRVNAAELDSKQKYSLASWWRKKITWFNEQQNKELIVKDFNSISKGNNKIKQGIVIAEADKNYEKVRIKLKPEVDGYVILYAKHNGDDSWDGNLTKYNTNPNDFLCNGGVEKIIEIEDVEKGKYIYMIYIPTGTASKEIEVIQVLGIGS